MASCCYLAPVAVINLADPCVCNMPGGGVLVLSNGDVYIRTTVTTPCNLSDWQLFSGASCTCAFDIQDAFTNTQTVNGGDTLSILGQNGITAIVSAPDTITINGLTTFSNLAPIVAPTITTDVNIHLNCATSTLYVWCPSTSTWLNVSGSFTCTLLNTCSINDLGDVVVVGPVANQVLTWNGVNWVNTNLPNIDCEQVQDCMSTALAQFAVYNDIANNFTLASIDAHSDVDTTTIPPVANQVLSWNGVNWIPTTITAFTCEDVQDCMSTALPFATYNDVGNVFNLGSVNAHSDVDTTTVPPVNNQALVWNGVNWIPGVATCPATNQSTVHYGYDGTNYGFFNVRQKLTYRSVSANTVLVPSTDGVIGIDASGGNRIVTLIAPNVCDPQDFWIKRLDNVSANSITISATSIDGVASITLATPGPFTGSMGETVHLMHIGSNNWIII